MEGPSTTKGTAEANRDAESTTENRFRCYEGFVAQGIIMALVLNEDSPAQDSYSALLGEIKERIRSAQYAALRG
jgi:hypothetical protein